LSVCWIEGSKSDSEGLKLPAGTIKTPRKTPRIIYYLHVTQLFDPGRTRIEIIEFFSTRVSTPGVSTRVGLGQPLDPPNTIVEIRWGAVRK
jgi:hypothetical protein